MQQSTVPVRLFHNSLSPQLFPCIPIPLSFDLACRAFLGTGTMTLQFVRDNGAIP